jgi:hypothetical protein
MKNTLFILLCAQSLLAQSTYEMKVFQDTFAPLENATSILDEIGLTNSIFGGANIELDMGFDFPFFDGSYDSIIADSRASHYFPNTPDFGIFLFTGDFSKITYEEPYTNWYYKRDTSEFGKVLIFEWSNFSLFPYFLIQQPPIDQTVTFRHYLY